MTKISQLNVFACTYKGMYGWLDRFMLGHNKGNYRAELLEDGRYLIFFEERQWAVYDPVKGTINTNVHIMKIQW